MIEREPSKEISDQFQPDVIVVHGSGLHDNWIGKRGWLEGEYEEICQKLKEERSLSPRQSKILHWLVDYGMGIYCLPKSSWDARMRLTAAGELWQRYKKQGKEVPIIVVGGDIYPSLTPLTTERAEVTLFDPHGLEKMTVKLQ